MNIVTLLTRLYGPPHEALHVLALYLVGKRPAAWTWTHVDLPPNLSKGEYLFVAGLPALVFWGVAALGVVTLVNGAWLGLLLILLGALGGLGTVGDLQLMAARWLRPD